MTADARIMTEALASLTSKPPWGTTVVPGTRVEPDTVSAPRNHKYGHALGAKHRAKHLGRDFSADRIARNSQGSLCKACSGLCKLIYTYVNLHEQLAYADLYRLIILAHYGALWSAKTNREETLNPKP